MAIHERYLELSAMSVGGEFAKKVFDLDELPRALKVIKRNDWRCAWFELCLIEIDTEDGAYSTLILDNEMYNIKREG